MKHNSRRLRNTGIALAALTLAVLWACTSLTYYMPRPKGVDDTLLVVRVLPISNPEYDYRIIFEDGTRIRVFPKYPMTFVRGLPAGTHRVIAIAAGEPGGRSSAGSDVDIEIEIERGTITVFPLLFAVSSERTKTVRGRVTQTERCTFSNLTQTDMLSVRAEFDRNLNARAWNGFPYAPIGEASIPDTLVFEWKKSWMDTPERGCFPAGTNVLTPSGPRAIETLSEGDLVRSYDTQNGVWEDKPVTRLLTHEYDGELVTFSSHGRSVTATANHPVWILGHDGSGGQWVEAGSLSRGDRLLLADSTPAPVSRLSSANAHLTVYNIEVADFHTYAVGNAGFLVHNKGGIEVGGL